MAGLQIERHRKLNFNRTEIIDIRNIDLKTGNTHMLHPIATATAGWRFIDSHWYFGWVGISTKSTHDNCC